MQVQVGRSWIEQVEDLFLVDLKKRTSAKKFFRIPMLETNHIASYTFKIKLIMIYVTYFYPAITLYIHRIQGQNKAESYHDSNMTLWRKEGNVLFNDALNTFYLRLYGVRHMVKDHSDSEKGNPLLPHRLLFPINSKGSFICTIPQTG